MINLPYPGSDGNPLDSLLVQRILTALRSRSSTPSSSSSTPAPNIKIEPDSNPQSEGSSTPGAGESLVNNPDPFGTEKTSIKPDPDDVPVIDDPDFETPSMEMDNEAENIAADPEPNVEAQNNINEQQQQQQQDPNNPPEPPQPEKQPSERVLQIQDTIYRCSELDVKFNGLKREQVQMMNDEIAGKRQVRL